MSAYDEKEAEQPLDPAAERLRRKLVRLLFVSGGIMMLGLIAVLAAIIYKVGESGKPIAGGLTANAPVDGTIAVPPGHQLVATALGGDRALLTLEGPGGVRSLILVDLASGAVLGRYALRSE